MIRAIPVIAVLAIASSALAQNTNPRDGVPAAALSRIDAYCAEIAPESYSLREVCTNQEILARNNIYGRIIDDGIFSYCYGLVPESYSLMEVCIKQEEAAKARQPR